MSSDSIGLYVHVPFCATLCGYCDFYSEVPGQGAFGPLVDALLIELEQAVEGIRVETIFVGGGTPSLLPPGELGRLFERLGAVAGRDGAVEFTVEANPASLTDAKAAILRDAGVNRVSMGAQSFFPHELRVLDRIHSPADIPRSAEIIHRTGFAHFNLDLIFGVPGQTDATWAESIRRAIGLGPDHLACYGLTYEEGTPLTERLERGLIVPAEEEDEASQYEQTIAALAGAGFEHYEISNFAKPGARSRHNLRYWLNLPGRGIGPSAASYIGGRRWRNVPDTKRYAECLGNGTSPRIDEEELPPAARAGETAMLGLRLVEGVDLARFGDATGFDFMKLYGALIEELTAGGLLRVSPTHVALTRRGLLLADAVIAEFLQPEGA